MERFIIEENDSCKGRATAISLIALGVLSLVVAWYAGGYLFAFTIGIMAGLMIAYYIAREYLAGLLGG